METLGIVTLLNKHHYKNKPLPEGSIFIGRPSLFGNPFSHLPQTRAEFKVESRKEAVRLFAQWLAKAPDAEKVRKEVYRLAALVAQGKSIFLVCFCCPLECHGDVLKHHILRVASQIQSASSSP